LITVRHLAIAFLTTLGVTGRRCAYLDAAEFLGGGARDSLRAKLEELLSEDVELLGELVGLQVAKLVDLESLVRH
jgi:hypothetical protein